MGKRTHGEESMCMRRVIVRMRTKSKVCGSSKESRAHGRIVVMCMGRVIGRLSGKEGECMREGMAHAKENVPWWKGVELT
jgi:hypothetical protein